MNASFVLAAPPLAQVIGGMETNTWDLQHSCKHIDGLLIAVYVFPYFPCFS